MSDLKPLQLLDPTNLPAFGNYEIAPAAASPTIVANLMLVALVVGCAGFWVAVIMWLAG